MILILFYDVENKISTSTIILIIVGFVIYSTTGVFCKFASSYPFFSLLYILFFLITIVMLCVYAIMWQLILTKVPLNIAFICKSSTLIYSLLFAHFLFGESITDYNIVGAIIILIGLVILAWKK